MRMNNNFVSDIIRLIGGEVVASKLEDFQNTILTIQIDKNENEYFNTKNIN